MAGNNKVKDPNTTPLASEYSWGPGVDAPLAKGAVRTPHEMLVADYRTDSLDPASFPDYSGREDSRA